ncbi:hypothetical protein [Alicyclobacillus kakegawensis]|uniref:hypothetical protein n=1 Tax=Alicyclobacillus kakegawensis TaxID=392012 RepID=UPI00082B21A3|nr:hypothetical protein [Alicyclobacillus kakegawensis]
MGCREVVVTIMRDHPLPVDQLLYQIRKCVQTARREHPELADSRLHDVRLRVCGGTLEAVLEFHAWEDAGG